MNEKNHNRLQEFRQLKKEIPGSHEHLIVGLDVAKDKHHAFMGTANCKTLLKKLIFENNLEGFSKLFSRVEAIRAQNSLSKVVYAFEPTGNYHKPLQRHLIAKGCNVVIVTGQAVKNNRETLYGRWDKNDIKDAANVAELVSRGKFLYCDNPCEGINDLRDLLSLRRRLKKEEHSLKMRIRNSLLTKYFPELDRFYNACEGESLAIVRWCLNPRKIAQMPFDQFVKLVTTNRRGIAQKLRLQKIHALAAQSIGWPMGLAADFEASLLVDKLRAVRRQIKDLEKPIEDLSMGFVEYKWLLTIPGFGPYISSKALATIGDPWRFDNAKQVLRLAGYDLGAYRSGKGSNQAVPVISKRGNSEFRYALYQAAFIASVHNRHFIAYFTEMLRGREREQGIKTKMRVKLAAKMLIIAWTLMKKQEAFNPQYLIVA